MDGRVTACVAGALLVLGCASRDPSPSPGLTPEEVEPAPADARPPRPAPVADARAPDPAPAAPPDAVVDVVGPDAAARDGAADRTDAINALLDRCGPGDPKLLADG